MQAASGHRILGLNIHHDELVNRDAAQGEKNLSRVVAELERSV